MELNSIVICLNHGGHGENIHEVELPQKATQAHMACH